ncbi:hypothetical protein CBR_g45243 [Chara braunii]|uniref:Uncharacterized protein n=1 Tax=Chara braunii TaxID=69332 RepID=A0A388K3B2_CHABU|nr:hypothetical protein CBR_g45243 [Chara braunii]GBG64548.1 hypothetical protein CBR_g45243 [Chara braunii]|eukprot:GBG64547.1 hypothetical protein CBR_g45243 [Chara braunii]
MARNGWAAADVTPAPPKAETGSNEWGATGSTITQSHYHPQGSIGLSIPFSQSRLQHYRQLYVRSPGFCPLPLAPPAPQCEQNLLSNNDPLARHELGKGIRAKGDCAQNETTKAAAEALRLLQKRALAYEGESNHYKKIYHELKQDVARLAEEHAKQLARYEEMRREHEEERKAMENGMSLIKKELETAMEETRKVEEEGRKIRERLAETEENLRKERDSVERACKERDVAMRSLQDCQTHLDNAMAESFYNFTDVALSVTPGMNLPDSSNCECRRAFPHCYDLVDGHIVSVHYNIISDDSLRKLFQEGSKYRLDGETADVLQALAIGLDEYIANYKRLLA